MNPIDDYRLPLVAILRGLTAADAPAIGRTLFDAGFRLIEVPLNRPGALEAMQALLKIAPADALVGAGTVLTPADVDAVKSAGGRFVVSPNCEPEVIRRTVAAGMLSMPGIATPTEAFRALEAGAHALKLFPAEMIPTSVVKALRSVLSKEVHLWPVGGVTPANMGAYVDAGADGFGFGGAIYREGSDVAYVKKAAEGFMQARAALLGGG